MASDLIQAPESLLWYWVSERHAIYLRRMAGQPKPWTDDPILQTYKFTNPFRENDRGTVWLRENFLTPYRYPLNPSFGTPEQQEERDREHLGLLAFNICFYRMFNWIGTAEVIGWQDDWEPAEIQEKLESRLFAGYQVFTGAHMVRSAFGRPKIDCIVEVCTHLWELCHREIVDDIGIVAQGLGEYARMSNSLQDTFKQLLKVPYVGPFMAYEMVTDMRHTRILENASDIMTWANPGPGAQRGLQRLGLPWKPDSAAIESMRILLQHSYSRPGQMGMKNPDCDLPIDFPLLEMRDIEHSLCEFDKYCRAKFGEGRPRSKYPGAA